MNRLGAALTGEVTDPPIQSLYILALIRQRLAPTQA